MIRLTLLQSKAPKEDCGMVVLSSLGSEGGGRVEQRLTKLSRGLIYEDEDSCGWLAGFGDQTTERVRECRGSRPARRRNSARMLIKVPAKEKRTRGGDAT